jgi:hypothetical protein
MEILYDIYIKFGERESSPKVLGHLENKKTRHNSVSWRIYPAGLCPGGQTIIYILWKKGE